MTGLAVVAGEWRLKAEDRRVLNTVFLPWALRAGTRAADLMCIYYEKHLEVGGQGRAGQGRAGAAVAGRARRPPGLRHAVRAERGGRLGGYLCYFPMLCPE